MDKFEKYLNKENSPMLKEHLDILEKESELPASLVLPRDEINKLFEDGYLEGENGYRQIKDGTTYVSVLTKMPDVTIEMIDWWFWWHAAEAVRYQIWYPEMHYNINADFQGHYNDETKSYRERLHLSTYLVTEDVGLGKDEILIDFMSPVIFGFDENKLDDQVTIVCARVGSPERGVWGTDMCHFVRMTASGGVEMRSRFWIGHKVRRMSGFGKTIIDTILNQPFVKRKNDSQRSREGYVSSLFSGVSQFSRDFTTGISGGRIRFKKYSKLKTDITTNDCCTKVIRRKIEEEGNHIFKFIVLKRHNRNS